MLHWTRELCLRQPWENIFTGNSMLPFNDPKLSNKYFCFQKKFWKFSSAYVGYSFENQTLLFCWESKFSMLKVQNCLRKTNFQGYISHLYLSAQWLVVWHTWLNNFAIRQRNHSNSKNDNRKRKLFRKRNLFSSKYFSGSANFWWWNPQKNFLTERPFFPS